MIIGATKTVVSPSPSVLVGGTGGMSNANNGQGFQAVELGSGLSGFSSLNGGSGLGFDIATFGSGIGTVGLLLGGFILYILIAGGPAQVRKEKLRKAKKEYEDRVRRIKHEYTRTGRRTGADID